MSASSYDWGEALCLHTFIAGGRYVRVAGYCRSLPEVWEALIEHFGGGDIRTPTVYVNTLYLSEEDYNFIIDETDPDIIL